MHDIYVRDIIEICGGKLLSGSLDLKLGDFCNDTRKIKTGDVYIGIKGEVFDGNKFYLDAIEKGANVCILDNVEDSYEYGEVTVILVDDTIKCIQELASYKREMYDIPVIAITGSVGKTSTKDMVASVVEQKYKTCKTIGNYNNHIGVPLTILSLSFLCFTFTLIIVFFSSIFNFILFNFKIYSIIYNIPYFFIIIYITCYIFYFTFC